MGIDPTEYQLMQIRLAKARGEDLPLAGNSAAATDEEELQEEIINHCRRRGWYVDYSRMDKRTTRPKGTVDLTIWADRGRVFAVECKARKGKLTPEQLGVKLMLEKLGHKWACIRSLQEFIVFVDYNNNPPQCL